MKTLEIKPNYAELGRELKKDWRTVKKYYEGYEGKHKTRSRSSKLDKFYDEIKTKINLLGATGMGVYQYIFDKDNKIGTYSNFKKYLKKHNLRPAKSSKVHPRFETDPGEQLQVDWKEDIKMISRNGKVFEFNIFTTTLGMSRLHDFVYSRNRTREEVERCIISTLKYMNGVPKHILTDNMSTIVDINGNKKRVNPKFNQFAKDMGFSVKLCKARSPETKGKDESTNRFIAWLIPYNNEFEDEEELLKIIEKIRNKVNATINQTTNVPPILLFEQEKEYLSSLANKSIIDSYLEDKENIIVSTESLIYYRGEKYSVYPKYINQKVRAKQTDNTLYIYHNKKLIATHEITSIRKPINYTHAHYVECLKASMPYLSNEQVDEKAKEALRKLDNLKKPNNLSEVKK